MHSVRLFVYRNVTQSALFFNIKMSRKVHFFLIPFLDLNTIGATFAPTSVCPKIFNIHFQRTYATESNSA